MVLESFARLTKKEKYRVDIVGHSGEEAVIPYVPLHHRFVPFLAAYRQ